MELWDAYDMNLNKIKDKTLIRGEAVPDGMYHLVCEVIVKHTDGTYLLMQRDKNKHYGEYWEATAGGSALQGENPLECAIRELREETGINETNLVELGRVVQHYHHSIYVVYIVISDSVKENTKDTFDYLRDKCSAVLVMLTGDTESGSIPVARELDMDYAYVNLMPEDKMELVEDFLSIQDASERLVCVGDRKSVV